MTSINYKSDFDFILDLAGRVEMPGTDYEDKEVNGDINIPTPGEGGEPPIYGDTAARAVSAAGATPTFPSYDFVVKLWTTFAQRPFVASCIGGKCTNLFDDNGSIHIVVSDHGLSPGRLHAEIVGQLPNGIFADQRQKVVWSGELDINLVARGVDGTATEPIRQTVSLPMMVLSAYRLAVAAGYEGTEQEYLRATRELVNNAEIARNAIEDAQAAANTARGHAVNAANSASAAYIDANRAEAASRLASNMKESTFTYRSEARGYRDEAAASERSALNYADQARTAAAEAATEAIEDALRQITQNGDSAIKVKKSNRVRHLCRKRISINSVPGNVYLNQRGYINGANGHHYDCCAFVKRCTIDVGHCTGVSFPAALFRERFGEDFMGRIVIVNSWSDKPVSYKHFFDIYIENDTLEIRKKPNLDGSYFRVTIFCQFNGCSGSEYIWVDPETGRICTCLDAHKRIENLTLPKLTTRNIALKFPYFGRGRKKPKVQLFAKRENNCAGDLNHAAAQRQVELLKTQVQVLRNVRRFRYINDEHECHWETTLRRGWSTTPYLRRFATCPRKAYVIARVRHKSKRGNVSEWLYIGILCDMDGMRFRIRNLNDNLDHSIIDFTHLLGDEYEWSYNYAQWAVPMS